MITIVFNSSHNPVRYITIKKNNLRTDINTQTFNSISNFKKGSPISIPSFASFDLEMTQPSLFDKTTTSLIY